VICSAFYVSNVIIESIKQFFSNKGGFNDVNTFYHVKYWYLQAENRCVCERSAKKKNFWNVKYSKMKNCSKRSSAFLKRRSFIAGNCNNNGV
jgi:hypothetical protein